MTWIEGMRWFVDWFFGDQWVLGVILCPNMALIYAVLHGWTGMAVASLVVDTMWVVIRLISR